MTLPRFGGAFLAAAVAVFGRPVPRKDEPIATTSGKRLFGRIDTLPVLSPYQSTVPAIPCAPHARPGPFTPNANGAARALFWGLPAECRLRRESARQAVMPVVDANTMF
jgi:hypothetical protein